MDKTLKWGQHSVSLKPFSFTVTDLTYNEEQNSLFLEAKVLSVDTGEPVILQTSRSLNGRPQHMLPPHLLGRIVEDMLMSMLRHEVHECLFVNGVHVVKPSHK